MFERYSSLVVIDIIQNDSIVPTLCVGMQPVTLCVTKSGRRASSETLPRWSLGAINHTSKYITKPYPTFAIDGLPFEVWLPRQDPSTERDLVSAHRGVDLDHDVELILKAAQACFEALRAQDPSRASHRDMGAGENLPP
ncbi:hypothetical protein HX881_28065 [Pseudomonas gingeri]|uniref:hypothetical protein n=1 Tax=Pseudomonas gingeri TaxID=117681 RepID=UPI0015A286F8|nr:hypothetical protein [Pseudomonas gingeri]NVZ29435.1 hypothetical protein [Pseudomonas gingeri]